MLSDEKHAATAGNGPGCAMGTRAAALLGGQPVAISMPESALHFSRTTHHAAPGGDRQRTPSDERMTPKPAANEPDDSRAAEAGDASESLESPFSGSFSFGRASLEETLRAAASGDQQAWRAMVETYSGRVFGLIRAQCNNMDLAEEITQSTFCTIVAKIGGYTELGKFEQWLFRIAMNRLRDEMRRRKRQARTMADETLSGLAAAGETENRRTPGRGAAPQSAPDSAEIAALRAAMAELPDADQQIIHLRHYGELSFKQIAEILDQPLGTVLARQHRALKKLAEILKGRLQP